MIASFNSRFDSKIDSKTNDNQTHPITIHHNEYAIKLDALLLLVVEVKGLKVDIRR